MDMQTDIRYTSRIQPNQGKSGQTLPSSDTGKTMQSITHKDVFDFCVKLVPGFTYNQVEDALGLKKSALQRLFSTPAFRKVAVGYALATTDFDDWCRLADISFAPRAIIQVADSGGNSVPEVANGLSRAEIKALLSKMDWTDGVSRVLSGQITDIPRALRTFDLLYYAVRMALNDPRYSIDPESIWESEPL